MQFSASGQVDSRIVELKFENQQFEQNAKTSLSTLDRLKAALDFSKTKQTFTDIGSGLKSISIGPLNNGVQQLTASFSALDVMATRALMNITDSIQSATAGFVKSVTIDQVSAGWDKYADKTSAVQTIMAATAKNFADTETQMEYVNGQLEKLNWFTDETSYNFLDMVNNIGKFTSNNVDLETSVTAMEGISNWAAVSGAGINEAGRAMYNLSQAIAVGSVKLMDWKSIENANMATAEFKQTVIDTAEGLGLLTKAGDGLYETLKGNEVSVSNFNQSLSDGWFTSKVLLDTLERYGAFTDKLNEFYEAAGENVMTSEILEYIDDFKEGQLDLSEIAEETGLTVEQINGYLSELSSVEMEFGLKAFKAAQEAKTFQEAVDSVKDAVSTGWMNTYELMFGDYLEAKDLWSTLAEDLYEIFAEGGNSRNELLKEAFAQQENLTEVDFKKLNDLGLLTDDYAAALREAAEAHTDLSISATNNIEWLEKAFKEQIVTIDDLETAYDNLFGSGVESKVNEGMKAAIEGAIESNEEFKNLFDTLDQYKDEDIANVIFGSHKYEEGTEELEKTVDAMMKTLGYTEEQGDEFVNVLRSMDKFGGLTAESLAKMSDEQLISAGYTKEQVDNLREYIEANKEFREGLDEFEGEKVDTGQLWTESLYKGMEALVDIFKVAKGAWAEVFPPTTADDITAIIVKLHDGVFAFSDWVKTSDTLKNAFKAVFSVLDIGITVGKGLIEGAIKVFSSFIEGIGFDAGRAVNYVSSLVFKARQWIKSSEIISKTMNLIAVGASFGGKQIRRWFDAFRSMPAVNQAITKFKATFKSTLTSLPTFVDGLTNAFTDFGHKVGELDGIRLDNIGDVFQAFKDTVLKYFMEFPGFRKVAEAFKKLKDNIKDSLAGMGVDVDGIKTKLNSLMQFKFLTRNVDRFKKAFKKLPTQVGPFIDGLTKKWVEFTEAVSHVGGFKLGNIKEIFGAFKDTILGYFTNFEGFDPVKQAFADLGAEIKSRLSDMGIDIDGIKEKINGFIEGIKETVSGFEFPETITNLFGIFKKHKKDADGATETGTVISEAITEITDAAEQVNDKSFALPKWLKDMASSLLSFAIAIGVLRTLHTAMNVLDGLFGSLAALNRAKAGAINKAGLLMLAGAVGILATSVYMLAKIPVGELWSAVGAVAALTAVIVGLSVVATKFTKGSEVFATGGGLALMAASVLEIALAIKVLETVKVENIPKVIGFLMGIMMALVAFGHAASKFGGGLTGGAGILAMVTSIYLMIGVLKILDNFSLKNPAKVVVALIGFLGVMSVMFLTTKLLGKEANSSALAILAMAGALALMAGALLVISLIDTHRLVGAVAVIGVLSLCLAGLMVASRALSGGSAVSILMIGVTIAALAASLAALTMLDQHKLDNAAACLSMVIGILTVFSGVTGLTNVSLAPFASMLSMIGILVAIAYSLTEIAKIPADRLSGASDAITKIIGVLTVLSGVAGAIGALAGFSGLIGVGVIDALLASIMAIVGALGDFAGQGIEALIGHINNVLPQFVMGLTGLAVVCSAIPPNGFEPLKALVDSLSGIALGELKMQLASFFTGQDPIEMFKVQMPQLVDALKVYSDKLKEGDFSNLDAVEQSANAIALLASVCSADIPGNGLIDWLTGNTPDKIAMFSSQLGPLAEGLNKYASTIDGTVFNEEKIEASKNLVEMLVALSENEIPNGGIFNFLFGNNTKLADFGNQLIPLAEGLNKYASTIDETVFNDEKINASRNLVSMLSALAENEIPQGGIFNFLFGNNTKITDFANQLVPLAEGLNKYASTINATTFTDEKIEASKNLAKMLADLGSERIQDGGLIGKLSGSDTKITEFANQLADLAVGLNKYSSVINTTIFTDEKIKASKNLATMLADLGATKIQGNGFFDQLISGSNTKITAFGSQLGDLATGLAKYANTINEATFSGDKIKASKNLGEILASLAAINIPDNGFFDKILSGSNTKISAFGEQLPALGTGVAGFAKELNGVTLDGQKSSVISSLFQAIGEIGNVFNTPAFNNDYLMNNAFNTLSSIPGKINEFLSSITSDEGKISSVGSLLSGFGEALSSLSATDISGSFTNSSLIDTLKNNVKSLVDLINNQLANLNTSGVDSFKSAVEALANTDISAATEKLSAKTDGSELKAMQDTGKNMGTSLASSMGSQSGAMESAMGTLTGAATKALSDAQGSFGAKGTELVQAMASAVQSSGDLGPAFNSVVSAALASIDVSGAYNAGYNFVAGFANGISMNAFMAQAQARAMALAALNAANAAINAHSPARELIKTGRYFAEGFAIGIDELAYMPIRSAENMAQGAVNGMSRAIDSVREILSADLDGDPVVRPVLDLTEIEAGAGTIGGLLSNVQPIRLMSDLDIIQANSRAMRNRASTDDLIAAISSLEGGGTTNNYNVVDGVTYDDGSNIAAAVRTLVHAVRAGGRA